MTTSTYGRGNQINASSTTTTATSTISTISTISASVGQPRGDGSMRTEP
jgi:hypothetical protein